MVLNDPIYEARSLTGGCIRLIDVLEIVNLFTALSRRLLITSAPSTPCLAIIECPWQLGFQEENLGKWAMVGLAGFMLGIWDSLLGSRV